MSIYEIASPAGIMTFEEFERYFDKYSRKYNGMVYEGEHNQAGEDNIWYFRALGYPREAENTGFQLNNNDTKDEKSQSRIITDKSELMRLIQDDPMNLQFGSDELRNDKDVVSAAMQKEVMVIGGASTELQNDIRF